MPPRPRITEPENLRLYVPEGLDRPAHIPPEVLQAALRTYLASRRLDMQALAVDLGIGRTTLYRRVGSRDRLLEEVAWYLARGLLALALQQVPHTRHGRAFVVEVTRRFMVLLYAQAAHRRFLEEEPEAALRVLTARTGRVQSGIVDFVDRLIVGEITRGALRIGMESRVLAYAIVRIAEGFLYSDVVANAAPDVDHAIETIDALLTGTALVTSAGEESVSA